MRLRSMVPLYLCLATAAMACGSDTTQPTGVPSTVSFTYAGDRNGSYTTTGFIPDVRTGTLWTTKWATAGNFSSGTQGFTGVSASLPTSTGNQRLEISFPYAVTGTFPLSKANFDALIFDFNNGVSNGQIYFFNPGTVTVTSATADRVVGTFSGTAIDSVANKTIVVTNGSFDVHIGQP